MAAINPDAIISAVEARDHFSDVLNRVSVDQERILVTRYGKAAMAVVPVEDLAELEYLEDESYREEILRSIESVRTEGTVPWEQVRVENGLA
jgi:prevent-host-death family protein